MFVGLKKLKRHYILKFETLKKSSHDKSDPIKKNNNNEKGV